MNIKSCEAFKVSVLIFQFLCGIGLFCLESEKLATWWVQPKWTRLNLHGVSRYDQMWLLLVFSPWDKLVSERGALSFPLRVWCWSYIPFYSYAGCIPQLYFLSLKYDIKRLMERSHSTHSKLGWLPPLLVDSVVAEEACGAGREEIFPLPQNLPPRLPAPSMLRPPWISEVSCGWAEFCSTVQKHWGCTNSD